MDRSMNQVIPGRSRVRMLVAVLSAFVVLCVAGAVGAGGAGAQEPPKPTWSMDAEMTPGQKGTVTGEGFQPGATVTMTGPGNVVLAEAVADSFGRITMSMTVPMDMTTGAATMSLTGMNIGGEVVILNQTVNIGALVGQGPAEAMPMTPAFTG